ncbi:MAG: hypothetical protein V4495_05440 [Pseudomonadota bacterium]
MFYHRIESPQTINVTEIRNLISPGWRVVIQFGSTSSYTSELLAELNQAAKLIGPDLQIRFWGHYSEQFDASVLRFIPDAENIIIDGMNNCINICDLSYLRNLKELNLGASGFDIPDILSIEALHGLDTLFMGENKKSNIDLIHLRKYLNLRDFGTGGQVKNIDVITQLPRLSILSLFQMKNTVDLSFVSEIQGLQDLSIKFGGYESIADIDAPDLRELKIMRVRGLKELGDIGRFPKLGKLEIEGQIQLSNVKLGANPMLRNIYISTCKTLSHMIGFEGLPKLEQLWLFRTALNYDEFISVKMPSSLRRITFFNGGKKKDESIEKHLASKGYQKYQF